MKKLILIALILSSCTAQKRCEYHLKRATALGCLKTTNDTITKHDTIRGFSIDTVVQFSDTTKTDTLWMEKDGIKVKTVIRWRERIVEQEITKRDTIITTVYINKNTEVLKTTNKLKWWHIAIYIGMAVVIIGLVTRK